MAQSYIKRILNAQVYDVARETPLDAAPLLTGRLGNQAFLKRDDLQPVFSFKCRGAYNKMVNLDGAARAAGVVAASAGNHAQGVALAASKLGIKATIVMPVTTPLIKVDAVKALGAQGVIDRDSPNLIEAAHHALEDHAVDVVADLVGGTLFNRLLQLLRPEGRYTTAGAIGGPVVELDLRTVYLKHLAIHGSSQGTRGAFKRLMHYINTGKIKPILDRQFKLSDFHQAQAYFMEKHFVGKVVVVPDAKWADRTST